VTLAAPEWLALLPFLAFAAWRWRWLALWSPVRLACLALLLSCLAQPRLPRGRPGLDVWLLVDRSASARDLVEPRRAEVETLLERARAGDDLLHVVDFAEEAALRSESHGWQPRGTETRLASAIRFALNRQKPGRSARLLLLGDGFSTEPLHGLAEPLIARQVALDLRRLAHERTGDYRVESVDLPAQVMAGEPFLVEARVAGAPDGEVPVTVLRDGQPAGQGTAHVSQGRAVVRFTDSLSAGGAYRYAVQLQAAGDPVAGNNRAEGWTTVRGGRRVILITSHPDHPLAAALQTQGFTVETVTDPSRLSVGRLTGARLVVIDDVPAHVIPPDFLASLDAYVRVQGGGFLMTGGRRSFGSGGYFGSKVDALLPVSMELKDEHRRLATAMAIVLDRSGSMAADAGGVTKMDLANAGAARSIELLGDADGLAVLAVDSDAHLVVPLSALGSSRGAVTRMVRSIQSTGGGIYVYTGLAVAWKEIENAPYGQRHVILFADAADAEEPGNYIELLARLTAKGGTVSVIGLGRETDGDAEFLRDVARRGKGRIFFSADPGSLPAIFAQETVTVARSAFVNEKTGTRAGAGWLELAQRPLTFPPAVDGYNLSYLRPEATAALSTTDEYAAPLVAFWNRGAGRTAAVSFPVAGERSQAVREWPAYGDFAQTLGRWLAGQDLPPGIGLRTRRDGTEIGIELLFDPSWEEKLAQTPPQVVLAEDAAGEGRALTWERIEPGRLRARAALAPGHWYRGAVQLAGATLPFGPVGATDAAEWALDPARLRELEALAAATGGGERADLASIWKAPRPGSAHRDLRPFLLLAVLGLFLAESLRVRLGLVAAPTVMVAADAEAPSPAAAAVAAPDAPAPPQAEPLSADEARRRRRFDAAKRDR